MISDLILEGGGRRENAAEGVYVAADDAQMMPIVDADGYGSTYPFIDGQVRFASTRSELSIISSPEGPTRCSRSTGVDQSERSPAELSQTVASAAQIERFVTV